MTAEIAMAAAAAVLAIVSIALGLAWAFGHRHNPGAPEAVARGCLCPTSDNHYGAGRFGDGARFGWYIVTECKRHRHSWKWIG